MSTRSSTFNLAGLMLLEQAVWYKGPTLATPPLEYPTLDDEEILELAMKVGSVLVATEEEVRPGDFFALPLSWREIIHLIQGISIYDEAAGDPVGLTTLRKLYKLLLQYEAETIICDLGFGDAEVKDDHTYKGTSTNTPSGSTQNGTGEAV